MRPCATPGCTALVKSGRCEKCEKVRGNASQAGNDRDSSCRRGYDRKWQAFRSWFLHRHPLCADCKEIGNITPAEEVHHVEKLADRPELRCVEGNCRALCKSCHSIRTARGE